MAGTTIFTSTTVGVSLTAASQNPVKITATGTINVAGSYANAIYAALGIVGTISNLGTVLAPGGYGIRLHSGGTVTNGAATAKALISGGLYGVRFDVHGTGLLTNFGTVTSTSTTTGAGVLAVGSATIKNGSATSTAARISGYANGVAIDPVPLPISAPQWPSRPSARRSTSASAAA